MGDDDVCKIYDKEDAFTSFVQVLLAGIALGSLYIKRNNERPRRKFMTWWLDVSKQGIGAVYAHISNMYIAAIISENTRGDYELKDQCAWYSISFLVDTTVGLFFSLILLGWLNALAQKRGWHTLMNNGVYELEADGSKATKDGIRHWRNQVLAWVVILTLVRVLVMGFIWVFSPILARAGDFLFEPLQGNIRFELLFVMILFPGILNFFYFWVADHYLKAGAEHSSAHESFEDDEVESGQAQSQSQSQPTSDYVATGDDMKEVDHHQQAGPPTSPSFELPEVKPNTVRTLI